LIPALIAAVTLLLSGWYARKGNDKLAFIMGSLTIIFATIMVFTGLYPRILISSLDPANSLTIYNASASPYALKIMTIVAAIFVPIVLIYQSYVYKIFHGRVKADPDTLIY